MTITLLLMTSLVTSIFNNLLIFFRAITKTTEFGRKKPTSRHLVFYSTAKSRRRQLMRFHINWRLVLNVSTECRIWCFVGIVWYSASFYIMVSFGCKHFSRRENQLHHTAKTPVTSPLLQIIYAISPLVKSFKLYLTHRCSENIE